MEEGAAMTSAIQAADAEQQAPAHGWWPLTVIASAHLMAVLDTTVMFVALPSVQHALGLSVTARQWILTAYTLAFAALLLVGGRLADRFGARRTLLIGVAGFALASALGGWCLYVNVAVSLVAIIAGPRVLPALPARREIRIDLPSALLASAGMAALVYGLGEAASAGWGSAQAVGSLATATVALAGFAGRQAGHPGRLLPLRVVGERNRGGALIASIVNSLSTFSMLLQTSLRGVRPSDTGAASAAGSAANQLGSSIGAALLNTIAATATAAFLASHAGATAVTATVHGYTTAMAWGARILLVTAIPAVTLINAKAPSPRRQRTRS
jgi:MFS family permease